MRKQGDTPLENYKSQLKKKLMDLRAQQNKHDLTDGLITFITGIRLLPPMEKHYFLKWMKFGLDPIAQENLSRLRDQYKEKCKNSKDDPKMFAELDKLISASSLGVEHFMSALGQFYEAECSMVKEGKMAESQRQFTHLPGRAADLMLEGFPMEIIDGDVSNIPLQWVTDVLRQLHAKLGGRSKMLVLMVLGVQSTGKSTLLNTMFGLQFAQELGCDFILVIDTEGLEAPELAKLEDSYQHDNELATLVIGLSDITIVNMDMENATEMQDVLQIVVHAFLRMEKIGKKTNCQFVHQNVSDVFEHEQNMRDRKHLLEQLNEMTKAAANMEKKCKEMKFSDIMDYDLEKYNCFRNNLVAEAYNQLSVKYAEWEWGFRKEIPFWVSEKETFIQNQPPDKLDTNVSIRLKSEAQEKLRQEAEKIVNHLQQYFESGEANLHLIEKYKEDFRRSANSLRNELESYSFSKWQEAIHIKKGQHRTDAMLSKYKRKIEEKVDGLLNHCRKSNCKLNNDELEKEFENMWRETLSELSLIPLQRCNIFEDVEFQLKRDLADRGSAVWKMLQDAKSLCAYKTQHFKMKKEYLDLKVFRGYTLSISGVKEFLTQECWHKTEALAKSLIEECNSYTERKHLGKLKPQYLSTFKALYLEKDECQDRAWNFCDQCLRPALVDYVNKRLGTEIVDDILSSEWSVEYSTRSFFQFFVLKQLLEENDFNNYVQYTRNYVDFIKTRIQRHLLMLYKEKARLGDLEKRIFSPIINKLSHVLKYSKGEKTKTVSAFLDNLCEKLQQDLVIPRDSLEVILSKNTASADQFSAFIEQFIPDLEKQVLSTFENLEIQSKLSKLAVKPQDEIFKRVFGCGKQCPFCKVPCEAGAPAHDEHFA
ncbi:unnamed protein product [Caretta caretta]